MLVLMLDGKPMYIVDEEGYIRTLDGQPARTVDDSQD